MGWLSIPILLAAILPVGWVGVVVRGRRLMGRPGPAPDQHALAWEAGRRVGAHHPHGPGEDAGGCPRPHHRNAGEGAQAPRRGDPEQQVGGPMTNPVPGRSITTPYGKTGRLVRRQARRRRLGRTDRHARGRRMVRRRHGRVVGLVVRHPARRRPGPAPQRLAGAVGRVRAPVQDVREARAARQGRAEDRGGRRHRQRHRPASALRGAARRRVASPATTSTLRRGSLPRTPAHHHQHHRHPHHHRRTP